MPVQCSAFSGYSGWICLGQDHGYVYDVWVVVDHCLMLTNIREFRSRTSPTCLQFRLFVHLQRYQLKISQSLCTLGGLLDLGTSVSRENKDKITVSYF